MKVLQVLNHFLPQQTAGTEVYAWALSKYLQQNNIKVEVVIPGYGKKVSATYIYDSLSVFEYAEPSVVNRSLIMGLCKPEGLKEFTTHVQKELPDIVHFHELAGSNGISLHHVEAAKASGAKVLMTFHLAGYTCRTGTLLYKNKITCNGLIDVKNCSACFCSNKGMFSFINALLPISSLLHKAGINSTSWNNKAGTALGTYYIQEKLKKDFDLLIQKCDHVVVLTNWYKKVLLLNGVDEKKITFVPQALPINSNSLPYDSGEKTARLKLVFLGRIDPLKGLHILIKALKQLPEQQVSLDIYGQKSGKEYERYWRNKTSGNKNIQWKGQLKQEEVVPMLSAYDALCLCSTFSEMSPLVIQEAFAARIPVLAANVYGNAEQVLDGENGWLFRFKDIADLKNKIKSLIEKPSLIENAKLKIPGVKSFKTVAEEHIILYKKVLSRS